jgi:hypothetical protein
MHANSVIRQNTRLDDVVVIARWAPVPELSHELRTPQSLLRNGFSPSKPTRKKRFRCASRLASNPRYAPNAGNAARL